MLPIKCYILDLFCQRKWKKRLEKGCILFSKTKTCIYIYSYLTNNSKPEEENICMWDTSAELSEISIQVECMQRNIFEILLNQTELRLHLPFSDWLGTKRTVSICCAYQSENGRCHIISVWFNRISKIFLCV